MNRIRILYRSKGSTETVSFTLDPVEYYDPLEADGETYERDGIPRYVDPRRYVPDESGELSHLVVTEPRDGGVRELRVQYLDGPRSYCLHALWPDGREELIHSTDLTPGTYHLIRTSRDANGYWTVTTNVHAHHDEREGDPTCHVGDHTWAALVDFWVDFARSS